MKNLLRLCLLLYLFLGVEAWPAQLPRQLIESDRIQTLKVLGFGGAIKTNTDPTPLGGYKGFEFFISSDVIPINELQKLGDESGSGDQLVVTTLGFGKGVFFDIDTFLFFSPLQIQNKISQFGGFIRKVIYVDPFRPFQIALNFHGTGITFENLISTTTTGLDVISTYQWPHISLSLGIGQGRSIGTFYGGDKGINSTVETFSVDLQERHWLTSIAYHWDRTYLSFQYDRYFDGNYGAKLGYRF